MRSLLPNKQSNYYQKCKTTNHHYKPLVVNTIYNNTHLILVKKKLLKKSGVLNILKVRNYALFSFLIKLSALPSLYQAI